MVGDEDQSIYGFRAAYPQALLNFEKDHPKAQVLVMDQNYRSNAKIVSAADLFIQHNKLRHEKHRVATKAAEKEIADIVEDVKPKGGLSWKGKAAIFGGVALGALALVGVASMVMSGGRQQNSNLYNPYQAMY